MDQEVYPEEENSDKFCLVPLERGSQTHPRPSCRCVLALGVRGGYADAQYIIVAPVYVAKLVVQPLPFFGTSLLQIKLA